MRSPRRQVAGSNPAGPILSGESETNVMFHVYVLRSVKTGRRYVGSCQDVDERLRRHNAGQSKATRHGVPWIVLQTERFSTRSEAARRERYYKNGRGRDELAKLGL